MWEYRRSGLTAKFENPLSFNMRKKKGGAEAPLRLFMVTMSACSSMLVTINRCRVGCVLPERYAKVAKQAHINSGASAKNGHIAACYALAVTIPGREVNPHSSCTFRKKRVNMSQNFPSELYMQWYRLYGYRSRAPNPGISSF